MGKIKRHHNLKSIENKGNKGCAERTSKIGANTPYELTKDRMTAFGGAFGLVKFLDMIEFSSFFANLFSEPGRKPKEGCYFMVYGIMLLLFIGFSRLGHFSYIQLDPMLCGIFGMNKLPAASTYWRFLNSLGHNQSQSLLNIVIKLRERVWQFCQFSFETIHIDIDTTVETIYGNIEGARKGHNTKHRGKKALRPILAFIAETREYLCGNLRRGTTVSAEEFTTFIYNFTKAIPSCVKKVILRADGEFISGSACKSAEERWYFFIFANKSCKPPFLKKWYKVHKKSWIEYNSCEYKPQGWDKAYRFVAMRIPKDKADVQGDTQIELFEEDNFKYRIFVTNLKGAAHKVIREYDFRADCENLVGESKREGLAAIPSKKFKNNKAFFQLVMLTFNVWRYLKFFAAKGELKSKNEKKTPEKIASQSKIIEHPIVNHTTRIARLKLLFIAAKMTTHNHRTQIKYSIHDNRVSELFLLFNELDRLKKLKKPWEFHDPWNYSEIAA